MKPKKYGPNKMKLLRSASADMYRALLKVNNALGEYLNGDTLPLEHHVNQAWTEVFKTIRKAEGKRT